MIDPKKLKAFGGKKAEESKPDLDEEEDEGRDATAIDEESQGIEKFATLLQMLGEDQEEVEQCIAELDAKKLADPDGVLAVEDQQILKEGFTELDEDLQEELTATAAGISRQDAAMLADHLFEESKTEDPDRFEGWLFNVGQMLGSKAPAKAAAE